MAGASIFPSLPRLQNTTDALDALSEAATLTNEAETRYALHLAAGHAYVLRVERDIRGAESGGLEPTLDLRSIYGMVAERPRLLDGRMRFRINKPRPICARRVRPSVGGRHDRRRPYAGAQMHLLLLRFHNRVMDLFENARAQQGCPPLERSELFRRAHVRHHALAVGRVLRHGSRLVDRDTFRDVCSSRQRHYTVYSAKDAAAVPPAEFTHALTHLHVHLKRDTYPLAAKAAYISDQQLRYYVGGLLPPVPLNMIALFEPEQWPGKAMDSYVASGTALSHRAQGGYHEAARPEVSNRLRRRPPLRRLLRAANGRLPSGYDVAKAMGVMPIAEDELVRTDRTGVLRSLGLSVRRLPLLVYLAKEAEIGRREHAEGGRQSPARRGDARFYMGGSVRHLLLRERLAPVPASQRVRDLHHAGPRALDPSADPLLRLSRVRARKKGRWSPHRGVRDGRAPLTQTWCVAWGRRTDASACDPSSQDRPSRPCTS